MLTRRIEVTEASVYLGYTFVNKVVDLYLTNRQHPGISS